MRLRDRKGMKSMGKVELRKKELLDILQKQEAVSVKEIADLLDVSLPTARRMCTQLANEGKAIRTHGGIKALDGIDNSYSFDELNTKYVEEKMKIARYASSLVKSDQVIFIEAGTTLRHFASALAERIKRQEISNVVIFTNSLINLNILHPVQNNIILIGGQYRDERKDFTGYISEMSLHGLQFNYSFIGADAVSLTRGAMAMDMNTVRFDTELVHHSEKVIILAGSEKFNKNSLISYVDVNKVHAIITDNNLDADIRDSYRGRGINLVTV